MDMDMSMKSIMNASDKYRSNNNTASTSHEWMVDNLPSSRH